MPCPNCRKRRENITAAVKAGRRAFIDGLRRAARECQTKKEIADERTIRIEDAKASEGGIDA